VRVLWVIKGLGPGGAERLLVEHASAGDRTRFAYEVAYLLSWKQHLVTEIEAHGVPTQCLGVRSELDPRWIARLYRMLRGRSYDVIHVHSPAVAAVTRVLVRTLPRARRPAVVYTEHNVWSSHNVVTRTLNALTYPLDDATLAVSEQVRSSVWSRWRSRVQVVVHGVDVDRVRARLAGRDETRRELGVRDGETLAVTVANLRATKNYPGLLAAARAVIDDGASIRFVAAGQGPLEAEVRARHRELALGDRFELLGYRDDTTRLIAAADLFVLASHHEGLPVTVMEALTLGVPVVAPAIGGLPEVVTTGVNGILVAPDSPGALAVGIERAAEPAEHARLAAGARTTGEQFSSREAVRQLEAVYARVAGA
jgi:glycosyltransferase involved in cell wall biosynthesis